MSAIHPLRLGRPEDLVVGARYLWRRTRAAAVIGLVLATSMGACEDPHVPTDPGSVVARSAGGMVDDRCSPGDARALLESLPISNEIFLREGPDHPWAETLLTCQYRLFWESGHPVLGQPVSFSQEDHFLGGIVGFVPYENLGMTRAEAEAILAAVEVRIGLAEVTEGGVGELVRQPVLESAFKQAMTDRLGLVLWKQWGFITSLPRGEYLSVTELARPLFFEDEFRFSVSLFIH